MFELKYPSIGFRKALATSIVSEPRDSLPCCMTREQMAEQAIEIGIWEFGPDDTILVWLDREGEHKLSMPLGDLAS